MVALRARTPRSREGTKPDGTEVNDARAYNTTAGCSVMGKFTLTDAGSYSSRPYSRSGKPPIPLTTTNI